MVVVWSPAAFSPGVRPLRPWLSSSLGSPVGAVVVVAGGAVVVVAPPSPGIVVPGGAVVVGISPSLGHPGAGSSSEHGGSSCRTGRKRSSAVWPTSSSARSWSFTPGSWTRTVSPCRVMSGSATPRASTRFRMISTA